MRLTFGLIVLLVVAACGRQAAVEKERKAAEAAARAVREAQKKAAAAAAKKDSMKGKHASTLTVTKPGADAIFTGAEVEVMESFPVQFAVTMKMQVPSPDHTVAVESVGEPDAANAMVAIVRQTPPKEGSVSLTVIDHKPVRFALGSLAPGEYELRIKVRDGAAEPVHAQAVKLTAK